VVSYHFPPDGAIGGLRWAGITKYLARAGWTIDVLAGGEVVRPERINGSLVHSVRRARTVNDAYGWLAARRRRHPSGSSAPDAPPADGGSPERGALRRLRHVMAVSLSYPDYARGWVLKAGRVARRIMRRQGIDVVVSSGPPHTAHLVGLLATAGTRARWVMDMRDPWSEMDPAKGQESFEWLTRRVESVAFSRADLIICNTQQFAGDLRARRLGDRVHWIPNGIDVEDLPESTAPSQGPLTLAYVGTLYFNRDLGPVIKAMEALLAGSSEAAARGVRLMFAGHADPAHAAELERQLRQSGLDRTHVSRLGRVSRDEARKVLQEAHLSLVLAQGQPLQVPAKLYESMGMGVQTLVLAEPGSAAGLEAQRIGALWRDPSDLDGIRVLLEELSAGRLSARPRVLERFDYQHTADRFARVLSEDLPAVRVEVAG